MVIKAISGGELILLCHKWR